MIDDDFLSCLGYNLTDSCTPCPADSGIDLSSMELDLWPLNCGTSLGNLQKVESNCSKGDLEDNNIQMESGEVYLDASLSQCSHYCDGSDARHSYVNSDRSYFTQYQSNSNSKPSSVHYSASSSSPPPCEPRSSTPPSNSYHQSNASFSASTLCSSLSPTSINSISYSFHPTIQMNPPLCSPQTPQSHSQLQTSYFNQNPNPGHISVSQQGIFPTSMSVNLSMNMTMGFATSDQCQPSVPWSTASNPHPSSNYGVPCSPSQTPDSSMAGAPGIVNQVNQVSSNYFDSTYSPSYSSPPPYTYQGSSSEAHQGLKVHAGEKEYAEFITSTRSGSPLSERSANEMNVRFNYHKGKMAQELARIQELSRESDEANCGNGTSDGNGLPPNLCRICNKTYARPSTLKTHLRTHSGERPYRCPTCNKSFSQAANLTAHIRTHSGEKPFGCPVCSRKFSQSSSVTTHMRTHSGERPYRCCICKKAFSDSSTLTKHLRIHSGEKPYQCKLCLLRFSQSGNLNRHMRIHANIN